MEIPKDLDNILEKGPNNKKCSQCNSYQEIDSIKYCKECKICYCVKCLQGHNEIFKDHELCKYEEANLFEDHDSLLANPDYDLDDRILDENDIYKNARLHGYRNLEKEEGCSDLEIVFHETLTSIEEIFNEKICKIKRKRSLNISENKNEEKNKGKEKGDNDGNVIIENNYNDNNLVDLDLPYIKSLPPLERLKVIMQSLDKDNDKK